MVIVKLKCIQLACNLKTYENLLLIVVKKKDQRPSLKSDIFLFLSGGAVRKF